MGDVGFGGASRRAFVLAVAVPAMIVAISCGIAVVISVVTFPASGAGLGATVLDACLTVAIFTVVLLGEEIGWRGFLRQRLRVLTSGRRRAALLTGACHAAFHIPLPTLTPSAGDGPKTAGFPPGPRSTSLKYGELVA